MTTSQIASWFGILYGNSKYIHEYDSLSDAKTQFALEFSNFITMKQMNIDSYYNTLFNKINNFIDKLEFTKEGKTTLEKHKGRKESTNTNVKDSFEENTKRSEATDITEHNNDNYSDSTSHGKTVTENGGTVDEHYRVYFGNSNVVKNSEDRHKNAENNTHSSTAESGSTSISHTSNGDENYKQTVGNATDNYNETIRHAASNYHEKVANAINNYTTIEDISASIFDNDVMDYNNYKETTKNSWHEVQVAFQFLGKLSTKTFVEEILKEFFNYISYNVE